jgi:hypothetical protein
VRVTAAVTTEFFICAPHNFTTTLWTCFLHRLKIVIITRLQTDVTWCFKTKKGYKK